MSDQAKLRWGHLNINVTDLDASIHFYQKLGFSLFLPGIPYLGLSMNSTSLISDEVLTVTGWPSGTSGRACIMQLGDTFPKIDLTELSIPEQADPLSNNAVGLVRFCLGSEDLDNDYQTLLDQGVKFVSPPITTDDGLADLAICVDPDGTLIELIQPHLEKWVSLPRD
jgi:catechol 2,3-dioxygenase-like lactoylglutathione lyase family enzyme